MTSYSEKLGISTVYMGSCRISTIIRRRSRVPLPRSWMNERKSSANRSSLLSFGSAILRHVRLRCATACNIPSEIHHRGPQRPHKHEDPYILVPRPNTRGTPDIMLCRILMHVWPFGALSPEHDDRFSGLIDWLNMAMNQSKENLFRSVQGASTTLEGAAHLQLWRWYMGSTMQRSPMMKYSAAHRRAWYLGSQSC